MPQDHEVHEGEGISSIAFERGLFPDTVWNDPANVRLRSKRKDRDVLLPGDIVVIPDKRLKEVDRPTEQLHRFRRKGVPAKFRLQVLREDLPVKNAKYVLNVDGRLMRGTTDNEGVLKHFLSPAAREAQLIVFDKKEELRLAIKFGTLDPVTETVGVQKRLNNLGFYCGEPDGTLNETTTEALKAFQASMNLEATGTLTDETIAALTKINDTEELPPKDTEQMPT